MIIMRVRIVQSNNDSRFEVHLTFGGGSIGDHVPPAIDLASQTNCSMQVHIAKTKTIRAPSYAFDNFKLELGPYVL